VAGKGSNAGTFGTLKRKKRRNRGVFGTARETEIAAPGERGSPPRDDLKTMVSYIGDFTDEVGSGKKKKAGGGRRIGEQPDTLVNLGGGKKNAGGSSEISIEVAGI